MSLTDPTKVDSLILSETMRRTSLRPYRLRQLLNTKSSSLMKQITQPTTYNSSYGRLLRNLVAIADSSSLATTKTKSLNLSTHAVRLLNFLSQIKIDQKLRHDSLSEYAKSWLKRTLDMMTK
jgi:hypothetical protein